MCVLVIVDFYNNFVFRGLEVFIVGLVVLVIGIFMGFNFGYVVNFVRDFGFRFFIVIVGWGFEVFT